MLNANAKVNILVEVRGEWNLKRNMNRMNPIFHITVIKSHQIHL